jgi:uncharacterized membrane protein (UPF0127 family)
LPASVFHLPQTARTSEEKKQLVKDILEGKNPLTSEGVILHSPEGQFQKYKNKQEKTVYFAGTAPGAGKRLAAGNVLFSHTPGGEPVGRLGTGFTDEQLQDMVANSKDYMGAPMRVEHMGAFESGLLRSPSWQGFETDKSAAALFPVQFKAQDGTVKAAAHLELADTPELRQQGLMGRQSLPAGRGMFFDKAAAFWMKNVDFPLDLVFLNEKGVILEKSAMFPTSAPDALKPRYAATDPNAAHAVELPHGWCDNNGIGPGDRMVVKV